MQIGFFAQGDGPHLKIAKHLIESANKAMPGVPLFLLTDDMTPEVPGAGVIRLSGDMPMGVRRVTHYSRLDGDWLFLDTDVLIKRDVRHVFQDAFEVAIASRDGTYMEGTKYAETNPYNFGVVFSRSREFWAVLLEYLKALPSKAQEWGGEQLLMCEMAKLKRGGIKVLPSSYNFTPYRETDDVSDKHILHLKGPRKAWITMFL